jgi:hypothetical protein
MQGGIIGTTVQYPGVTNKILASKLSTRDLLALSTPLLSCTVLANRKAADLNVGDPFLLDWPDYLADPVVMRVIKLALGNGKSNRIKITCTEDVFAFPDVALIQPNVIDWIDPSGAPTAAVYRVVEEAPYFELVQRLGQTTTDQNLATAPDLGYVLGTAAAPSGSISARLAVDAGAGYEDSPIVFCPYAFLDADLGYGALTVALTGASALAEVVVGTHAQIDDELVVVVSVTDTLLTMGRGVLDTVPTSHLAGVPVFFWDAFADGDNVEYVDGESIDVKMLTVSGAGELASGDAPTDTLVFNSRALRPYAPGNLKLNTVAYPATIGGAAALTTSWSHRDRLQQTAGVIIDTTSGDIGPEAGTSYDLKIYAEDLTTLIHTESAAATSYLYPLATEITDSGLGRQNGKLRITLETIVATNASYQMHDYIVARTGYGFNYGEYYGGV